MRDGVEALARLKNALPNFSEVGTIGDPDRQSKAALAMVVDRALAMLGHGHTHVEREPARPSGRDIVHVDPSTCPNCGVATESQRSPYCGDQCRERAAFVRQVRHGLASGSIFDELRQVAHGEKLWRLLGGGYPRRQALVVARVREKVMAREGGKCETCGAPATTVDHTGSG